MNLGAADALIPYYPRIEDEESNLYERFDLDLNLPTNMGILPKKVCFRILEKQEIWMIHSSIFS